MSYLTERSSSIIPIDDEEQPTQSRFPTPDKFDEFLPWACYEMAVEVNIIIIRQIQNPPETQKQVSVKKQAQKILAKEYSSEKPILHAIHSNLSNVDGNVTIYTIYDNNNNLVGIKFDKNKKIPREVVKIIGLILEYHIDLTTIIINRGLNTEAMYELNKLLQHSMSNITEICLDNAPATVANYEILLENDSHLNYLSLARCTINDNTVMKIASKLSYTLPASKTLSVLNLSSNKITDAGAKYLAEALRTNRKLAYLNLANNLIEDEGAMAILDVLKEFPVSKEELILSRTKFIEFCKTKQDSPVLKTERDLAKKAPRRKTSPKLATVHRSSKLRASRLVERQRSVFAPGMSDIQNPFTREYVMSRNSQIYCYGNNRLAYLNLSFNNIGYLSVKKLATVLLAQETLGRKPVGLVNVSIEGNYIPYRCVELEQIDRIIRTALEKLPERISLNKQNRARASSR